ncbi:hypothetical protein Vafri_1888, partial [Volvox africanus]
TPCITAAAGTGATTTAADTSDAAVGTSTLVMETLASSRTDIFPRNLRVLFVGPKADTIPPGRVECWVVGAPTGKVIGDVAEGVGPNEEAPATTAEMDAALAKGAREQQEEG